MSQAGLSEENDYLLLDSPWLGKKDQHGKTHLFKYSSQSDGQSFALLTTNLESIYFHSPEPKDIPAVPWEVDHPFLLGTKDLIREEFSDEPMEQLSGLVERIRAMIEERWDEVQLLIEIEDDVKVAYMRMDDFAWRLILNEVPPNQILPLLTRHLLHPLISVFANDRGIPVPSSSITSDESTSRLISDPEIMRAIRRATIKPKSQPPSTQKSQIPSSSNDTQGSPTPRKRVIRKEKESTPIPSSSSMPPSSPPRIPLESSSSNYPEPSSPPERPRSPSAPGIHIPSSSSQGINSSSAKKRTPKVIDQPSSSPSTGSAMDFKPPTQSQKTKREREKEEEDLMEKKMNEMKKKMQKGGTGKLGKRRLAR
ncbi:uncharacterized protein L201_002294 [Kwoniella dendrophila CBS 6074]|uniref:Uncharacterized protein n=1 Tax=Kwoniella dendrophila CBS 6074 TaxID=1295534 RepID=A0AAX4JS41_9TREE